jgi:hypothetical protein
MRYSVTLPAFLILAFPALLPAEDLKSLKELVLDRTKVTEKGIEELGKSLPNARIVTILLRQSGPGSFAETIGNSVLEIALRLPVMS